MSFVHASIRSALVLSFAVGCSSSGESAVEADGGEVVVEDAAIDTTVDDTRVTPVEDSTAIDSTPFDATEPADLGKPEDAGAEVAPIVDAGADVSVVKDAGSDTSVTKDAGSDTGGPTKDAGSDTGVVTKDTGSDTGAIKDTGGKVSTDITCGSATCDATTQWCCVKGGTDLECVPTGDICLGGDVYSCSSKSNCKGAEVCCYRAFGASCSTTCTGAELCSTSADCTKVGETCKPYGSFKSCQK